MAAGGVDPGSSHPCVGGAPQVSSAPLTPPCVLPNCPNSWTSCRAPPRPARMMTFQIWGGGRSRKSQTSRRRQPETAEVQVDTRPRPPRPLSPPAPTVFLTLSEVMPAATTTSAPTSPPTALAASPARIRTQRASGRRGPESWSASPSSSRRPALETAAQRRSSSMPEIASPPPKTRPQEPNREVLSFPGPVVCCCHLVVEVGTCLAGSIIIKIIIIIN